MRARALSVSISVLFSVLLTAPLGAVAPSAGRLDGGLLDPPWLGVTGEWRSPSDIDYLWVKPGFSLDGQTLELAEWDAPLFLNGERDAEDSKLALRLSESMPGRLESALAAAGVTKVSRTEGTVRLTGRFVDCNAGSKALRIMTGASVVIANATWDLKLVDKASGETLAAVHHRGVSGADSHNLGEKINAWLTQVFAPALHDGFAVYAGAKPVGE
jgi:hypothetical protein